MALRWELKVKDPGAVGVDGYDNTDRSEWVITESLIWASIMVGLPCISETNWTEYYTRVALWERLKGAFIQTPEGTPVPITPEDVHKRIGLECNVSYETRPVWMKRVVGNQMKDLERKAQETLTKENAK